MLIYSLVLTNGVVINSGEPWPGPDGKPLKMKNGDGALVEVGKVYQILFVPDTVESFEDEDGNPLAETTPAQYKVFMCAKEGGPLKNASGGEETQAYTIYASQVIMVGHVYEWKEALEEIKLLIEAQIGAVSTDNKKPNLQAVPSS